MVILNDFPTLVGGSDICQEIEPGQLESYIMSNYNFGVVIGLMQILHNNETMLLLHMSGNMFSSANPDEGNIWTSHGIVGYEIRQTGDFGVPDIKVILENGDIVIEGKLSNLQCAEGWSVKCYYFGVVPFEQ